MITTMETWMEKNNETEQWESMIPEEYDELYGAEDYDTGDTWNEDDEDLLDTALQSAIAGELAGILESELAYEMEPLTEISEDIAEDEDDAQAPISINTLRLELEQESVNRISSVARTEQEFREVIREMDRLDRNRERRERYHEVSRGEIPLEYQKAKDGYICPEWMNSPVIQQLQSGNFLDYLYDCPYEMHNLIADMRLSNAIAGLPERQKTVFYFLILRLYSTSRVAGMENMSDRNIRKIRNKCIRDIQIVLYQICKEKEAAGNLSLREKKFMYSCPVEVREKASGLKKRSGKKRKGTAS